MSNRERVLVVDEVSDTAEVLQAVLEPRGLTVNRINPLDQTPSAAGESPPVVVVLDVESLDGANCPDWEGWHGVPHVIIGTIRLTEAATREFADPAAPRRYLRKPFQFADLVQAIETLIARSAVASRPDDFPAGR